MQLLKAYRQIRKPILSLVFFMLSAFVAIAQPMAGNYTINKTTAATSTNFVSFQSFFNALAVNGVNGNVNATVDSGSGPYTEQASLSSVLGVSSTSQITINGNGEVIRFDATVNNQRHTLKLDGVDYVQIRNLTVEALGDTFAWAVHVTNNADNNVLDNCTIKVTNYIGIWGGIGIAVVSSNTNALIAGAAAKNLTITSCLITGETNTGPGNGIVINPQSNGNIASNIVIQHSRIEGFYAHGIYATGARGLIIKNNTILRPKRTNCEDTYAIRLVNSNQEDTIISNRIYNCFQSITGSSIFKDFYGIFIQTSIANILVANNAIYNNTNFGKWYGVYMACSKSTKIVHNTIVAGSTQNALDSIFGFYHDSKSCNNSQGSKFINNNIALDRAGSVYKEGIHQGSGAITVNHNNVFLTGSRANYGGAGTNTYKTLIAWQAASGLGAPFGENSTDVNPNFLNKQLGNLLPQAVGMDNNGANTNIKQDIINAPRGNNPDVGAFEFNVDANVKRIVTLNTTYCEGDTESISLWVVNNSIATISNFKLGFTFNSQPEIFETIKDSIAANDSLLIKLSTTVSFLNAGVSKLYARIKAKPQVGPKNVTVNPEPIGSKLSNLQVSGFFNGGDAVDPDIIAANDSSKYEVSSPIGFSNSSYGIQWQIKNVSFDVIGSSKIINASDTAIISPTTQKDVVFIFKPSSNLTGEVVKVTFSIENIITGCFSERLVRYIKIVGKPNASFTVTDVCEGESVNFFNNSSGIGTLSYKWYFGDGDSSLATNPQKRYKKPGKYTVILFTISSDNIVDSSSSVVEVYNAPDVGFLFNNQCEGIFIDFIDTTKVFYGNPTYNWDFGDGVGTANTKTPSYLYTTNGFYIVSLAVTDSLGCESSLSKRVTFAKKPTANFSFPILNCNQKKVSFTNNTTGQAGVGYTWFFGDGDSAIAKHIDHNYKQEGVYVVTLLAKNGFDCIDTVKKTITLLGTPDPDFLPSTTCANQAVTFNNLTKEPLSTEVSYLWTLNSTTNSIDESPVFTFNATGDIEVKLRAEAKNGCIAEIKRTVSFTEKPIADFVIPQNVCSGIEYSATNNTVLSNGSISYKWNLGNKTSTLKDPTDTFNSAGKYPIQLIAQTSSGCADTANKILNVIAIPNSDFLVESRKTGDGFMVFTPVEVNGQGNYNWVYSFGGGSNTKQRNEVQFNSSGLFTVSLQIINQGCASTTSKQVPIDLVSVSELKSENIKVYPNPSNGKLLVKLDNDAIINTIQIFDLSGKKVHHQDFNSFLQKEVSIAVKLPNGLYYLSLITKNGKYLAKISIVN